MQERSEINFSGIMKAAIALLVVAVVVHVVIWILFDVLKAREAKLDPKPSPMYQADQKPPAPQLQITPVLDLQKFHAAEQNLLSSYDWVDRDKGVVRIPVTVAMKLLVEKERTPAAQSQTQPQTQESGTKQ
jgi:hypothetical protein